MYSTYKEWRKLSWRTILNQLGDEEAWDYATALRGCDEVEGNQGNISNFLKVLFTCYLRGQQTGDGAWDIYTFENFILERRGSPQVFEVPKWEKLSFSQHWFIHTRDALLAVQTIQEGSLKELTTALEVLLSAMFYKAEDIDIVTDEEIEVRLLVIQQILKDELRGGD